MPYHEAARGGNKESTLACLRHLIQSLGINEARTLIYGFEYKNMIAAEEEGKQSPNMIIQEAALELGLVGKGEKIKLRGKEAKDAFQLAMIS